MAKSDDIPQVLLDNYEDIRTIGRGGFGIVYRGVDKLGVTVAIKQIPKNTPIRANDEIQALKTLNKNDKKNIIIRYKDKLEDDDNVYIVMEFCHHGTLREYLKYNGRLDITMACNVLKQLVEGVRLMHNNRIMHRDLTASNVLISSIDKKQRRLNVKLADFGLTKIAPTKAILQTCAGTPGYMAPQVYGREKYGKLADIYSLGAIFYSMLQANDPPKSLKWDENDRPIFSAYFESEEAKDLLERMMCKNEDQRISLDDVLKHPFIREARISNFDEDLPPPNSVNNNNRNSLSVERSATKPTSRRSHSTDRCLNMKLGGFTTSGILIEQPNNNNNEAIQRQNIPSTSFQLNIRKSNASTEMNTQRTSRQYVSTGPAKKFSSLAWPIKDVKHLAYQRKNKLGRFNIYNDDILAIRFEQVEDGFVTRIFEIYKYPKPGKQKFMVFTPKNKNKPVELCEDSDDTRNYFTDLHTIRSREDLIASQNEIQNGYRRIVQFIRMAESRVTHCTMIDPFNNKDYKALLKYDGTVHLNFPDGRVAIQTIDKDKEMKIENPMNKRISQLNSKESDLFKACLSRLRAIYYEAQRLENDSIKPLLIKPFSIVNHLNE